jgi:hypothetical protein
VRAAAGSDHVGTDASREAQHQVSSCTARRRGGSPRESQQRQRTPQPWSATDAMHLPVAGCAANLVGKNRNSMARSAQAVRRYDQIAFGATAGAIETARQQRYPHSTALPA